MNKSFDLTKGNRLPPRFGVIQFPLRAVPVAALLGLTGLGSAALQAVSGRQYVAESMRMFGHSAPFLFTVVSRVLNLMLVIAIIAMPLMAAPKKRRAPILLAFGAAFFFLTNDIFGSLFGRYPGGIEPLPVMALVAMVVTLVFGRVHHDELIRFARFILRLMVFGSLLCAVVIPDWSYVADSYAGSHRLIGLFNHPRALAIQAGGLFVIELFFVDGAKWKRGASMFGAVMAILLSVSKTTIALIPVVMSIYATATLGERRGGHSRIVRLLLVMLVIGAIPFIGYSLYGNFVAENASRLETLTGRSALWSNVYTSWLQDPMFGNGAGFFENSGYANAHNLFLQSLSDGGVVGVVGLVVFVGLLVRFAFKGRAKDGWLGISLLTVVLFVGLSENVFAFENLYSGEYFVFLLSVLCVGSDRVCSNGSVPLMKRRESGSYD
ncbi:O-antigen ligase family protein [Aerolutibacter daejeonensis]|nr:O-antigen ligase family protein [Lysobacter daejeonensis]